MLFRRGKRCIRELSGGRGGGRMRLNRELSAWTRLNLKQHNNIITNIICLNYISHFTVGCGDLLHLVSIHLGSPGIVNKFALIHSSSYLYTLDFYLRSIICIWYLFLFLTVSDTLHRSLCLFQTGIMVILIQKIRRQRLFKLTNCVACITKLTF